jgi:hypothetical protein
MTSYQSIAKQLEALREELTQRIDAIEKDVHHKKEPVEKDFAEQVTQRENDDVLSAIDNEAQHSATHRCRPRPYQKWRLWHVRKMWRKDTRQKAGCTALCHYLCKLC